MKTPPLAALASLCALLAALDAGAQAPATEPSPPPNGAAPTPKAPAPQPGAADETQRPAPRDLEAPRGAADETQRPASRDPEAPEAAAAPEPPRAPSSSSNPADSAAGSSSTPLPLAPFPEADLSSPSAPPPAAEPSATSNDAAPQRATATVAAGLGTTSTTSAQAQATGAPPTPQPPLLPPDVAPPAPRAPDTPLLLDGWIGVHSLLVPSRGYDVFAENDDLTSFSLGAGLSLAELTVGSLAAVASFSIGGEDAAYRGEASELSVVRLTLGPELRVPLISRLFAYGRLSPQLIHQSATLEESSSRSRLEQDDWLFGVDGAVGISVRLGEATPQAWSSPLCFFARVEAGYSWTPETELALAPTGSLAPIRSEPLELGDLSLSGASFRGAIGMGY